MDFNVSLKMSSWTPITEGEIWDLINSAWERMSIPQRRIWEVIRIDPVKWREETYGILGGGFWVVAIYGQTVIWYNDIEHGFNHSHWSTVGTIDGYWCNQSALHEAIGDSIDSLAQGPPTGGRAGPPQPLS